ncbi:MAG TPA: dihydroneopterin aldolase [Gaiellaceae bacterium]
MIVEVHGLEVFGHHGVNEDERRDGQTFLVDVWLTVPDPADDVIDATVDYRRVRDTVRAVSESSAFQLLETFAAAIAASVHEELLPERVKVRVRKPGVAWAEWTAVTVERP